MDDTPTITALDESRRYTVSGVAYWRARDIQVILGYKTWENFHEAIKRAMRAVEETGGDVKKHFRETTKKVVLGGGAQRSVPDYFIDRHGCYLTAMNGEPSIPQIATAQRYFAVQVQRQEMRDAQDELDQRIELRDQLSASVTELSKTASAVGVTQFAYFNDAGYLGLYTMRAADIKKKKGLSDTDSIYDRAGIKELAANAFHKTVTEEKIRTSGAKGQHHAEQIHRQVGQDVREVIRKHGGTMPEDLPPEPSLKKLESQRKKQKRLADKKVK